MSLPCSRYLAADDSTLEKRGITKDLVALSAGALIYRNFNPESIDEVVRICQSSLNSFHEMMLREKRKTFYKLIAGIEPIVKKCTTYRGSQCMVFHFGYAILEEDELGISCIKYMGDLCEGIGNVFERDVEFSWSYKGFQLHSPFVEDKLRDQISSSYRWHNEDVPYIWHAKSGVLIDGKAMYSTFPKEHICLV